MKFKNIRSLEDIEKAKLQLEKKIKVTERSITEKTDLTRILLCAFKSNVGASGNKMRDPELIGYLFPYGLDYVLKLFKQFAVKKRHRKLLIYSLIGGVLAFSAYQILGKQEPDIEE